MYEIAVNILICIYVPVTDLFHSDCDIELVSSNEWARYFMWYLQGYE